MVKIFFSALDKCCMGLLVTTLVCCSFYFVDYFAKLPSWGDSAMILVYLMMKDIEERYKK